MPAEGLDLIDVGDLERQQGKQLDAENGGYVVTTAWEQHGEAALARTAVEYPDRFVGICAHLLPKDVSVSLSARIPGNLEPDDWSIALATFEAIKQALPDASSRSPCEVLDFVLAAIRQAGAKLIER